MGADTEDRCPDCGGAKKASAAAIRAIDRLRTDLACEREATAAAQAVVVRLRPVVEEKAEAEREALTMVRTLVEAAPGNAIAVNQLPVAQARVAAVEVLLAESPADALATYVAERLAEADAAEEEVCTDDASGAPLVCVECNDPMRAGEGGWTELPDGLRHAYACEGRYWKRERDAARRNARVLAEAAKRTFAEVADQPAVAALMANSHEGRAMREALAYPKENDDG